MNIVQKARDFAVKSHGSQTYGTQPYLYHLNKVVDVARRFGASEEVLAACYLHDTVEDTKITSLDLTTNFGTKIAALVLGVTNMPDKESTLNRTRSNKTAVFIKLCDRIANCEEGGKILKYQKEMPLFYKVLYRKGEYDTMWDHLKKLLTFTPNDSK